MVHSSKIQPWFGGSRLSSAILILIILLGALILRLLNLSHGASFHPDERHIVMTTLNMSWSDLNPDSFAYGSFPFYLFFFGAKAAALLYPAAWSYDGLFLVGRGVSVAFGVLGVFLLAKLGTALAGRWAGLLAAALLAVNPFHIQLSRFATVDGILTTLNLAALLGCVRIIERKSLGAIAFTAIMTGLSLATKASSLSLLLPVALALTAMMSSPKFLMRRDFWKGIALFLAVTLVTLAAAQPYGFLDYKTFLSHTTEQINMVRGNWRPPYVVQYENTAPYLYHLAQMWHYTVGVAVFLAALGGLVSVTRRLVRNFDWRWLVVLAWSAAVFFVVGKYQVKFPRYLLPLYPVIMLAAAVFCCRAGAWLKARVGEGYEAFPAALVLLVSTFSGFSFVQIYRSDHGYVQASRWIYDNVPRGAKLLGVHWDDKLPLHLPGFSPRESGYEAEGGQPELRVYEPEHPQKLREMASRLSDADYLVFPTPRTYGSIPRAANDYPHTMRMFQLLFSGQLGYELVATLKVRPRLFGRVVNDDLADESLSIYDHPKTVIFRNAARLSAENIQGRILSSREGGEGDLPTLAEMLTVDTAMSPAAQSSVPPDAVQQAGAVLTWYVLLQGLAFLIFPLVFSVWKRAPDCGYALCKVLGLFLLGLAVWLVCSITNLPVQGGTIGLVAAILFVAAIGAVRENRPQLQQFFINSRREIITIEALFTGGFLVFLILRACNPEIHWGEKPMDFSFLNYFTRESQMPPDDPWFYRPGHAVTMSYYYLGFFVWSLFHKLTGVPASIGYNLALAATGAMLLCSSYTVLRWLTFKRWAAVTGAWVLVGISNLEVLWLILQGKELNFDLFWASSRGLKSPAITEYPVWSFLFADLHPHVMAMPLTVALIAILISPLFAYVEVKREPLAAGLGGVLLGFLLGVNSWDLIASSCVAAAIASLWLAYVVMTRRGEDRSLSIEWWLLSGAVFIFGAWFVADTFASQSLGRARLGWGFVTASEFNTFGQLGRHLGQWIIPLFAGAGFFFVRAGVSARASIISALVGAVPVSVALAASFVHGVREHPWGIMLLAYALLTVGILAISFVASNRLAAVAGALTVLGGCIVLGSELFFLMDRMNTIFKFYLPAWFFFGTAALIFLYLSMERTTAGVACMTISGVALAAGLVGSVLNVYVMTTFQRVSGPRPTLDGTAYLERLDGDEARLIRWIHSNVSGIRPTIEAAGNSYGEFTRVTMHTGLPTVLGWEYHVEQRGARRSEINDRKRAIDLFYRTTTPSIAGEIADRYGVELIIVGNVERRAYPSAGLRKFEENPDYFTKLASFGPVAVYEMRRPRQAHN